MYLGRIHQSKGLDLLVNAFFELIKEDPSLNLIISGPDDGYLNQLKKLIKYLNLEKNVIFTGYVTGNEKISLLSCSEISILPSESEAFGLSLLESIACNTPVICSRNCGMAELIHNKVGLSSNYSKKDYMTSIKSILYDEELSQNFRSNCEKFIIEYDWKNIIKKIECVYFALGD